ELPFVRAAAGISEGARPLVPPWRDAARDRFDDEHRRPLAAGLQQQRQRPVARSGIEFVDAPASDDAGTAHSASRGWRNERLEGSHHIPLSGPPPQTERPPIPFRFAD